MSMDLREAWANERKDNGAPDTRTTDATECPTPKTSARYVSRSDAGHDAAAMLEMTREVNQKFTLLAIVMGLMFVSLMGQLESLRKDLRQLAATRT